ncbi:MAG: multidrug transporter [Betaproteobacteria bacterium]|nr:multidrug transporter [Betaproteobacteria bacterium]
MIYESAVPVSRAHHEQLSVQVGDDYAFSRNVNSVPLTAVEFPHAGLEYAIVFAGNETAVMPAVILGLRNDENLYLSDKGAWQAKYIPAFVRRYPFVFSSQNDGKTFTLCIDERFAGFNREGKGQRLFADDGKPSGYTENVLKFLQEYQAQFQRTRAFCRKLKEHDLLEPMQAQVTTQKGERLSLSGFMAVNRDRLKKLSGDVLAQLAATDELELIYLHLQSMRNFNQMRERLGATAAAAA